MRYRYRELDVMTDQTGRRNEETKRNQASETAESAMNFDCTLEEFRLV